MVFEKVILPITGSYLQKRGDEDSTYKWWRTTCGKGCSFPLQREYNAVPATFVDAFNLIDSDLLLPSFLKFTV
jgi:hypothetical protein